MGEALADLVELLDLEQIELNMFRAYHPPDRQRRLYGGQIIAQSLIAAARTVVDADRPPHSLHGYFLRPGDPSIPALIDVERIRDGQSFTTRRVVVIQHGKAIFNMDVSFQRRERGFEHAAVFPQNASVPTDDMVPDELKNSAFLGWRHDHKRLSSDTPQPPEQLLWFKANGKLGDDANLHAALIVFESDNSLLSTARLPHRGNFVRAQMQMASLDHAMWFHHPARADQWLLYALDSPAAAGARGYNRGSIFTADGQLVATTMQEGLMRKREA
ncbi:MAG: acyl-CoA thioesterase II [Gammaproteobacteria bacterium]|nr:acyl-CoA thioesterase II [Gammaproteobacteria bacterium]